MNINENGVLMTFRKTAAIALAGILAASGAFAQTGLVEIDDSVMVPAFNVRADRLDDMDIHDAAGKKIGDIEEVLGSNASTPTAVSVDFDDDAVAGDQDRVVQLSALKANGLQLVLAADAAAIGQLPVYDD